MPTFPVTDPQPYYIKQFMDHTIELNLANWEFTVTGPEFDETKYRVAFASYKAARDEIEKRVTATQKIEAQRIILSLTVLDNKGVRHVIDRINRRDGEIHDISREFYPNVDWIREALQRLHRLHEEVKTLFESLRRFQLDSHRTYGRIEADRYAAKVNELKAEFQEKTRLAIEAAKLEEVAKSDKTA